MALFFMRENIARLYNCIGCYKQMVICKNCDHGQQYCNSTCSKNARQANMKTAGQRYQATRKGQHNHARRQAHYRRRKKIVTHHTSHNPISHVLIPIPINKTAERPLITTAANIYCCFCGKVCSDFIRLDVLRKKLYKKNKISSKQPQGP